MGKLNYDKWSKLELSDDSDIEGHPNVDHASLVRWKQRDIHEKREERKFKILQYEQELKNNDALYPRLLSITEAVKQGGPPAYSSTVERLKTSPDPEAPGPGQKTYDAMILDALMSVWEECKNEGLTGKDEKLGEALLTKLEDQKKQLLTRQEFLKKEIEKEKEEQHRKITSEDIHEGFSSSSVNTAKEPKPISSSLSKPKSTKQQTTTIETLNAPSTSTSQPEKSVETGGDEADDEDEEVDLPKLTPELLAFSKIKRGNFEESYQYLQNHRAIYVEGADDALLVAAFDAETNGQSLYAKNCVNQALLIQYCQKLGPDGPALFFRRAMQGHAAALNVFTKDVEDTYAHLKRRVEATRDEMAAGEREQVQLVASDPSVTISFSVPDGPPPEELVLDESIKDMDIEQVRRALQARWDIFNAFDPKLQEALKEGSLERVNKVLAKMDVPQAEEVVRLLSDSGIMDVADGGEVRDMTGKQADAVEA